MKMSRQRAMLLVMCLAAWPATAIAADSTLVLVMGGEAYDGPPKFEVDFDGKRLGEGTVAAAIDTAEAGRFADAANKTPYVQTFTFAVPAASFRPEGAVTVKFLNEAYGGEGTNHDRNLFLASVTLNGQAVTASGILSKDGGKDSPPEMLGEFLVIPDEAHMAITKAPKGGWPSPLDPVTTASLKPGPVTQYEEPIEVASLDPDPELITPGCDLDEVYNVIGLNENSNELTPALVQRLDQVAADIGRRQCSVTVTGYSSKQGAIASNALFAIERAQNALRYLKDKGVRFVQASATGVGATDQFGPDFRSNRRVVITVTP